MKNLAPSRDRAAAPRRLPTSATCLLFAAAAVFATAPARGADIAEIYAEAVQNDPVLAGARTSAANVKEGVAQARASFLPRVNASASRSQGRSVREARRDPIRRPGGAHAEQNHRHQPQQLGRVGVARRAELAVVVSVSEREGDRRAGRLGSAGRGAGPDHSRGAGLLGRVARPGGAGIGDRGGRSRAAAVGAGAAALRCGAGGHHRRPRVQSGVRQRGGVADTEPRQPRQLPSRRCGR